MAIQDIISGKGGPTNYPVFTFHNHQVEADRIGAWFELFYHYQCINKLQKLWRWQLLL